MGFDRLIDVAVSQSIIDETLRVMNDKFHAKPIVLESAIGMRGMRDASLSRICCGGLYPHSLK